MKKVVWLYSSFLLVLLCSAFSVIKNESPENLVRGKWSEVSWQYEKIDRSEEVSPTWLVDIEDHQKQEIVKQMVIHQAEVWTFNDKNELVLSGGDHPEETLKWKMKGRGNVLELFHEDGRVEDFQIKELTHFYH